MNTFPKREHLCSQKLLDELFSNGHRAMVFPYSIHWMLLPADALPDNVRAQVLIATSKRKFRHAVDRNRVKRLMRECYRLHKAPIFQQLEQHNCSLILGVNYIHNEIFDYHRLYRKFDKVATTLIEDIGRSSSRNNIIIKQSSPCQETSEP